MATVILKITKEKDKTFTLLSTKSGRKEGLSLDQVIETVKNDGKDE